MTPVEAVANALAHIDVVAENIGSIGNADQWVPDTYSALSLIDRLEALGFTVALAQDAKDAEALRLLREALDGRWFIHIHEREDRYVMGVEVFAPNRNYLRTHESASSNTIAEAADVCRAAIEARA